MSTDRHLPWRSFLVGPEGVATLPAGNKLAQILRAGCGIREDVPGARGR